MSLLKRAINILFQNDIFSYSRLNPQSLFLIHLNFLWSLEVFVSPHLFHSPQSNPLCQPLISCLVNRSLLLHISSRVRPKEKRGCWSNTHTNHQWQKHTFVAQHLALISDCQGPKRSRAQTLNCSLFFSAEVFLCSFIKIYQQYQWVIMHSPASWHTVITPSTRQCEDVYKQGWSRMFKLDR